MKRLNLGCGLKIKDGYINLDVFDFKGVDIIHDLNIFPYPFLNEEIDYILMDNCLEHLKEPIKVINELNRILKPEAKALIIVPYYKSPTAFSDLDHKNYFTLESFKTLKNNGDLQHWLPTFKEAKVSLSWGDYYSRLPIIPLVSWISNKWPAIYEDTFLSTLLPARYIIAELIK